MPEGPEVRRITDQLNNELAGKTITMIDIISGRYFYHGPPEGLLEFSTTPRKIYHVGCKGKFIYFIFEDGWSLWNTLGMSGSWSRELDKHSRLSFTLDNGSKLYFNDMRNFGTIKFNDNFLALWNKLDTLGPDILVYDMPDQEFRDRFRKYPNKTLAQALMDQKIVSGVGNYIKCEGLYLAKLSPHRTCSSLSDAELNTLNHVVKAIIRDSYKSGGSTFKTYKDLNGEVGNYGERFMIYRKKKDPAGREVIRETTKDKRTTHWVPEIQK